MKFLRSSISSAAAALFLLSAKSSAAPMPAAAAAADESDQFYPGHYPPSPPIIYNASDLTTDQVTIFAAVLNTQPDPDWDMLKDYVAPDLTYVSLTYDNPKLHAIMPWAGTHTSAGAQAFIDVFTSVGTYWDRGPFSIDAIFGDGQGNVTAWGKFTATSRTLGKTVLSPWSSRCTFNSQGKMNYFQWMEDTWTTGSSFGTDDTHKTFRSNPNGGQYVW